MKAFMLIVCFFSISFIQVSAQRHNSKEYFEAQYNRYNKMNKNGIKTLCIGGVLLAGGIAMAESAEWEKTVSGGSVNYTSDDPKAAGGILFIIGSIPCTIVGTILTTKGFKNKKEYRKKLEKLSIYPVKTANYTGLGLTYNF